MRLSRWVFWLFFLDCVPLLFSGFLHVLLTMALAADGLLVALVAADIFLTPRPERLIACARTCDDKLSLGRHNKVKVSVRRRLDAGSMRRSLRMTVRDEPPLAFDLQGQPVVTFLLPRDANEYTFDYEVLPNRQGDYIFGDIFAAVKGPLGLTERLEKFGASSPVKVYPNLLETEKYDLLVRRGLLMQVGIRTVRNRGGGSEFESLRDYVEGDEYRKIDWTATARKNKLITRQYQVEKSQNIILLIDAGRTMLQSIQKIAKLDYVINTALMLGYAAASQDDKVGLMVFDADVRTFIAPAKGKRQVYSLLNSLYNVSSQMVESDYKNAFEQLVTRWRRRSLVVLFTDLVDPDSSSDILDTISIIERLHKTVCVTVSDPNITLAASETPETQADVYRKAVAVEVLQERRSAISLLRRRNVWTVDSPPETLSADLINHYLELKARSAI